MYTTMFSVHIEIFPGYLCLHAQRGYCVFLFGNVDSVLSGHFDFAGKHEDEGNDNEWKWLPSSNNKYSEFGIGWVKYEKSLQMNQLKSRHRFYNVSIVLVVFICT
jgi:hypothetical protein